MIKRFLLLAFVVNIAISAPARAQTSFAPLAERLMPSVVNISTWQQEENDTPDVENDLLFASPDGRTALGSGFVISEDGYIATNYHVIEGAQKISVVTFDNKVYEAEVTGTDAKTDIALIKIGTEVPLPAVEFGDSDKVKIGDWVLAIGNPFGLGSSVTAGIISAKSRDIDSGPYDDYLQTDASINQGNSGGPMFDMEGKLIGINTAIFSTVGNSVGVGFALPSNQAEWVLDELKNKGKVERSWLGITVKQTQTETGVSGLAVVSFADDIVAEQEHLQVGDIILMFNGEEVSTAKAFSLNVSKMPMGSSLELKVWRNGKIMDIKTTTSLMPSERTDNQKAAVLQSEAGKEYPLLGLRFNGLTVSEIFSGSEAADKGVQKGDILNKINDTKVYIADELDKQIEEAVLSGKSLRLEFISAENGETYFAEIVLKERE